jgi:hypothetical protein
VGEWWERPAGRHATGDDPGARIPGAFAPVSLAALIRDGVPPPQLLAGDLLYRGCVHIIAGAPDCGKTTLCMWLAFGLIRQGLTVLMLDEESGPDMTAEKLIAIGATEDDAERFVYVPFPARQWTVPDIAALRALADQVRPAMVIFDSVAGFLARAGLDENAAADVTRWWSSLLTPMARHCNAAVVAIDHDTKDGALSRFSRGSGAKLAATDMMLKVELVKPFSRTENGVLRLTVTKDRRGWLHRWHDVQVRTQDGLSLFITEGTEDGAEGEDALTPAEEKLLAVLTAEPTAQADLVTRVAEKFGHGLRRQTATNALNRLSTLGVADRLDQGPGRAALWLAADPENRTSDGGVHLCA